MTRVFYFIFVLFVERKTCLAISIPPVFILLSIVSVLPKSVHWNWGWSDASPLQPVPAFTTPNTTPNLLAFLLWKWTWGSFNHISFHICCTFLFFLYSFYLITDINVYTAPDPCLCMKDLLLITFCQRKICSGLSFSWHRKVIIFFFLQLFLFFSSFRKLFWHCLRVFEHTEFAHCQPSLVVELNVCLINSACIWRLTWIAASSLLYQ